MFETVSNRLNYGTEIAAYSWEGLQNLNPKSIEIPRMSCWCYPHVYSDYVANKDRGVYNLPPIPKEAFSGDEDLKDFMMRVEDKYGKVNLVDITGKEIDDKNFDMIIGNFGAVEEHGHHLPLDSDNIRIYGLRDILYFDMIDDEIMMLPSLSYGVTGRYEYDFPGTINTGSNVLEKMVINYINDVSSAFPDTRTLFLTAHAHPDHIGAIEHVMKHYNKEKIRNTIFKFDFGLLEGKKHEVRGHEKEFVIRGHSSKNETSVIMFYRPGMVDLKQARGGKVNRNRHNERKWESGEAVKNRSGVNGWGPNHPKFSTPEFGRVYVEAMVDEIQNLMKTAY